MFERLFSHHLEDDEPLHLVVHKHWLFLLRALASPTVAFFLSFIAFALFTWRTALILVLLADCAIAVWFLRCFFNEFLDAWLITDRSVIDIAWHGWFHRTSTRIDYSSIEGVSYEVSGILGTLLGFGTVVIEKVGTGTKVSIENVPHPRSIESAILLYQEKCLRSKNLKDSKAVQDLLAQIVAERMNLKATKEKKKTMKF